MIVTGVWICFRGVSCGNSHEDDHAKILGVSFTSSENQRLELALIQVSVPRKNRVSLEIASMAFFLSRFKLVALKWSEVLK